MLTLNSLDAREVAPALGWILWGCLDLVALGSVLDAECVGPACIVEHEDAVL